MKNVPTSISERFFSESLEETFKIRPRTGINPRHPPLDPALQLHVGILGISIE